MRILQAVAILLIMSSCGVNKKDAIDKKVAKLLSAMTLEEKVGQMAQVTVMPTITPYGSKEVDVDKLYDIIVNYHIGSVLNIPQGEAQEAEYMSQLVKSIQDVATNKTRLKIPIIYGLDQMHGAGYSTNTTLFPQQIGIAATWDPYFARKMAEITAYETRANNVPWNFSPVLDLGGDPRFPRQWETFGEDPYVCSLFGREMVKGYEGDDNDVGNPNHVASCLKHFVGYGAPNSGKDRTPSYIPYASLLEYHVAPFKAAIDAGAHTVMLNSGIVNNEPVHASYKLATELLRNELGFTGVVVSDYEDIEKLHSRDKVAPTSKEAIKLGINAGVDMVMIPVDYQGFCNNLIELVNEGEVKLSRIDEAVSRILRLKYALNLFEVPNTLIADYPDYAKDEWSEIAYQATAESVTLLKNKDNILPLDLNQNERILVCGPNANSRRAVNGGWTISWMGDKVEHYPEVFPTIVEGLVEKFGQKSVIFSSGVSYRNEIADPFTEFKDRFNETIALAHSVDYVVVCVGENSYCEKTGDLNDLYLNDLQTELINGLIDTGKKIIVVLNEGRPRLISKFSSKVDAIIQLYLPGIHGPRVLAEVLDGTINPSGKLPYTYPAFPNSIMTYYHKHSDEQKRNDGVYKYEGDFNPEYHFGYGLSYTEFEYKNPVINSQILAKDSKEEIILSVDVSNTGSRAGKEVVQLYSSNLYASLLPDVKRLRRFQKIDLTAGETKTVTFSLTAEDLAFYNLNNEKVVETGEVILSIGASSNDIKFDFELLVE